jgi:putative redox protein
MTEVAPTRPFATATDTGSGGLQTFVTAGPSTIVADISVAQGGLDLGPDPHELVAAGLAACTTMTLRLYANRKNWDISGMHVEVFSHFDADVVPPERFERVISIEGNLNEEQRERLFEIAERCPIHKLLTTGARVVTTVAGND